MIAIERDEAMTLATERLILRPWKDEDRVPFALMAEDREVMRHLRPLPSAEACNRWIDYQIKHEIAHGYCLWAVQLRSNTAFIGAIGLLNVGFQARFTPATEVGWRLDREYWGQGYAPEGAQAALNFAFQQLKLREVVAHTGVENRQSRRVMEKLGMSHDAADDFTHPLLSPEDPLSAQMLYRARSLNAPEANAV